LLSSARTLFQRCFHLFSQFSMQYKKYGYAFSLNL
jgi:hypothetical protein